MFSFNDVGSFFAIVGGLIVVVQFFCSFPEITIAVWTRDEKTFLSINGRDGTLRRFKVNSFRIPGYSIGRVKGPNSIQEFHPKDPDFVSSFPLGWSFPAPLYDWSSMFELRRKSASCCWTSRNHCLVILFCSLWLLPLIQVKIAKIS